MYSPFPEEFNRKTISSMATYHFAPTENNRRNLLNEGMDNSRIFVTVCGLFEWKQICAGFYHLFIYILLLEIVLSKGQG
jgi:hypothetical protein